MFFLSLLLQCKFANSTLLSLLNFSYLITPYDAQASSAFSALIIFVTAFNMLLETVCLYIVTYNCIRIYAHSDGHDDEVNNFSQHPSLSNSIKP